MVAIRPSAHRFFGRDVYVLKQTNKQTRCKKNRAAAAAAIMQQQKSLFPLQSNKIVEGKNSKSHYHLRRRDHSLRLAIMMNNFFDAPASNYSFDSFGVGVGAVVGVGVGVGVGSRIKRGDGGAGAGGSVIVVSTDLRFPKRQQRHRRSVIVGIFDQFHFRRNGHSQCLQEFE